MTSENKEICKKLDIITNLLKDLLILELGKSGFNSDNVKRVLGKIDNNRLRRIITILNKISKKNRNRYGKRKT